MIRGARSVARHENARNRTRDLIRRMVLLTYFLDAYFRVHIAICAWDAHGKPPPVTVLAVWSFEKEQAFIGGAWST